MAILRKNGGIHVTVASQVKKTVATLKGNQATLRLYALQTKSEETRSVYKEALQVTEKMISDLESRVQTLEYEEPQYKGN